MIDLLVYLLVGVVLVAIVYWVLGQLISEPKLLKIARVIVALICFIAILYLIFPAFQGGPPHRLFR